MKSEISPDLLINALRGAETTYLEAIYLNGGCFQFYLFLKKLFPEAKPYINEKRNHVVTSINGILYDITGVANYPKEKFRPVKASEIKMVKSWSFEKTNMLQIGECPVCEEPLTV